MMTLGNSTDRAGGVVQVVECLLSKCKALSSNPSTEKKNRKKGITLLRCDELVCWGMGWFMYLILLILFLFLF
jgi:hypothetical protein